MPPFPSSLSWDSKQRATSTPVWTSACAQNFLYLLVPFSQPVFQPGLPLLCLICRNILQLTNHFEIADGNITIEHYDEWHDYFNKTYPGDVAELGLTTCDMQRFLDQVAVAKTQLALCISAPHNLLFGFALSCSGLSSPPLSSSFSPSRVRRVPAWLSSCSPKLCYRCQARRSGPCCSSSCSSSSASPPCSATSRASCRPSKTSKWCRRGCPTRPW